MRHGKSDWKDETLSDHERPLNQRGRRDIPLMTSVMTQKYPKPDYIASSDSARTTETIEGIQRLGFSIDEIIFKKDLYLAPLDRLESELAGLDNKVETALICAHNPGIADFINKLCGGSEFYEVPSLGMALIVLNINEWSEIFSADARLVRFDYPNKK